MDFALDAEQAMLRQLVRDFLAAKSPESAVRAQMADVVGYNEKLWRQMADQIGLQGLAIPKELGGRVHLRRVGNRGQRNWAVRWR